MKIGVLGLGNWGLALAQHLSISGFEVTGWDRNEETITSLALTKKHPHFHPSITISSKISFTENLEKTIKGSEMLVLAVPSHALVSVLDESMNLKDKILVSGIKGFVDDSLKTPLQYLSSLSHEIKLCTISGPSFAYDLIRENPILITAASHDPQTAFLVARIFSQGGLRVYPSEDPIGVEFGGALKNVIAVATGISDGLGFGDSTRAALVTRGLAEMTRLAVSSGAKQETLSGLSGLGDLLMTATSPLSRNRMLGFHIGEGDSIDTALSKLGSVAEGYLTAPKALQLSKKNGVELPITEQIVALFEGKISVRDVAKELLKRPLRAEHGAH